MSTLPEIVNAPVTLKFGETEILAKRATLSDLTAYDAKQSELKNDTNSGIKLMLYALTLCIKKAYPDQEITENYISDLVPLSFLHTDEMENILTTLGFMTPKKQ